MEKPIIDFLYVAFDKLFEDTTESGLLKDTENYASEEDPDRELQQHRRIWGTVIATPHMLDTNTKLKLREPGLPIPKRNITGEFIHQQIMRNPRGRWSAADYSCAGFDPKFVTLGDFEMLGQPGDKVYVHFDAFDKPLAEKVFLIRYDEVICFVRNGEIIMATDHNLVVPKTDNFMGQLLIIMEKPVPLRGFLLDGTEIMYMPNADWVNTIEGKDYYVVKTSDLIMNIEGKIMKPREDRVILEYTEAAEETEAGLMVPTATRLREKVTSGTVYTCGPDADFATGEEVLFAKGAGTVIEFDDKKFLVVRASDIFATL